MVVTERKNTWNSSSLLKLTFYRWKFFCFYIFIIYFFALIFSWSVFTLYLLFVVLMKCCFGVEGLNAYFIVFILEEEVSPGQTGWKINKTHSETWAGVCVCVCVWEREVVFWCVCNYAWLTAGVWQCFWCLSVCVREREGGRQSKGEQEIAGSGRSIMRQWRISLAVSATDLAVLPLPVRLHLRWPLPSSTSLQHLQRERKKCKRVAGRWVEKKKIPKKRQLDWKLYICNNGIKKRIKK